ncbi:MAG: hypothetical protein HY716_16315 [Planctomycetes bacterium]|nr:hypothetical protein [Planctomycetota bacterium]
MPSAKHDIDVDTFLTNYADQFRVLTFTLSGMADDASDLASALNAMASDLDAAARKVGAMSKTLCRECALIDVREEVRFGGKCRR